MILKQSRYSAFLITSNIPSTCSGLEFIRMVGPTTLIGIPLIPTESL
jgi:hypothetical protein